MGSEKRGRDLVKSVPVGVKPPGRRRTGFRCFWVAVGKGSESSVCELESRALERPGEGWRPPGPRPPRPPASSWSCCCSGSRRLPRHWPATSRWGPGERRNAVSFARCASAACERTDWRTAGSGRAGGAAWRGGSGGGPALRRVWRRLPRPPLLGAVLSAGGRAASAAAEAK